MSPKPDLYRDPLPWPSGQRKVLRHASCAPCSGEIIEAMLASEIDVTVLFYNPNIHPRAEYGNGGIIRVRLFAQHPSACGVRATRGGDHPLRRRARRALREWRL
nr:epoxyqueuosine reductase QueH [Thiococcus pfennigii]